MFTYTKYFDEKFVSDLNNKVNHLQCFNILFKTIKREYKIDNPELKLEMEVLSFNEFGYYVYYTKYYYTLNLKRMQLIPGITSSQPIHLFDKWPNWVNKKDLHLKK